MASGTINDDLPAAGVPFETWLSNPTRDSMTWVIAGRSCSGKSTLVENLLRLESLSASSDKTTVEVYHHSTGNPAVKVTIIDIPGLEDYSDQNSELAIIDQLQKMTQNGADILLYCVSIDPSSRLGDIDRKMVNLLTTVFKVQIWERAVLVLTFADIVKDRHTKNLTKNPTLENVMKNYAQKFEEILKTANIGSFTVLPLCHAQGDRSRPFQEIPALPASETSSTKLLPTVKWDEHLYLEMLTKCTLEAVPILVNVGKNQLSTGNTTMVQVLIGAIFGLSVGGYAYYIATSYFRSTSATYAGVLLGVVIGGVFTFLAKISGGFVWTSSARSIAKVRFQQDHIEKKQH